MNFRLPATHHRTAGPRVIPLSKRLASVWTEFGYRSISFHNQHHQHDSFPPPTPSVGHHIIRAAMHVTRIRIYSAVRPERINNRILVRGFSLLLLLDVIIMVRKGRRRRTCLSAVGDDGNWGSRARKGTIASGPLGQGIQLGKDERKGQ